MTTRDLIDIVLQAITLIGVVFAIYIYFRKPQEKSELNDAVFDVKFGTLEKMVCNLRDNHIHTIDQKLDRHIQDHQTFALNTTKSLTRVETLLDQVLKK